MMKELQEASEDRDTKHLDSCDQELLKSWVLRSKTATPVGRFYKTGWRKKHLSQLSEVQNQ